MFSATCDWFCTDGSHMIWRDDEHIQSKVLRMDTPEKRKRDRPKTRWKDMCQRYMKSTGLRAGEEMDRATWSRKIISHTGDMTGKALGQEEAKIFQNILVIIT